MIRDQCDQPQEGHDLIPRGTTRSTRHSGKRGCPLTH